MKKIAKLFDRDFLHKNLDQFRHKFRGTTYEMIRPVMQDPVFIIGCSRSGTTILYETLGLSEKLISFGYELTRFWHKLHGPLHNGWASEAADAENAKQEHRHAFFKFAYERIGPGRVLEKSCINTMRIPYLLALFPKAFFVFIVRDGRDNISSLMQGWSQIERFTLCQYMGDLPESVNIEDGRYKNWSFFLPPGWRNYNNASLATVCAYQWVTANRMMHQSLKLIPHNQIIQVKYEDFFENAFSVIEGICNKIDLPVNNALKERCSSITAYPTSIVKGPPKLGKWRSQNPEAIREILPIITPMMKQLGYM